MSDLNDLSVYELEAVLMAEKTPGWEIPAYRTDIEYAARQALHALHNLQHYLVEYEVAQEIARRA